MPALDSIEVEGYKSIRAAKIELGAINVLIGANGSGKSNLLGVFGLLADLADRRLQLHIGREGGADAMLHFGRKKTPSLKLSLTFGSLGYDAILVASAGDTLVFEHERPVSSGPHNAGVVDESIQDHRLAVLMGSGHKETNLSDELLSWEDSVGLRIATPVLAGMKSWRRFHFHDTGKTAPCQAKAQDRRQQVTAIRRR
jgi:predicted ATPase